MATANPWLFTWIVLGFTPFCTSDDFEDMFVGLPQAADHA